jgi:hypothetical protein
MHLQTHSISASKCICEFHSISAFKCITKHTLSRPPSTSSSSNDQCHQWHL